jgi:hypothetical protein
MPETLFDELKRYVKFGAQDEQALRELHPFAQPHFDRISEVFYQRILEHEGARKALTEGESMVGRLRHTLVEWMDKLLTGPWNEEYYQLRARIGRKHVDIQLPQHYMFGAMNVIRVELNALIDARYPERPERVRDSRMAVGKMLDLELAVMLHTYREDLLGLQDSGPGVDPAVRARLFEPLVTTRQKGVGLGLALVKRIVERHGGTVAYEPRGPGARFVVRLPRSAP